MEKGSWYGKSPIRIGDWGSLIYRNATIYTRTEKKKALGMENPQYENPQYENPQYENPQYENPQYENPQYETPPPPPPPQ